MFDGADGYIAFANNGATLCGHDVFGHGVDDGLAFDVGALNLISVVVGCGAECGFKMATGVKALALDSKLSFKCYLLHRKKYMRSNGLFIIQLFFELTHLCKKVAKLFLICAQTCKIAHGHSR